MSTLLTDFEPTPEWIAEEEECKRKYECVLILCNAWFESLESGSISRKRAIDNIVAIVGTSYKKGYLPKLSAERISGEYILKSFELEDIGKNNGIPSGMVKILKTFNHHLYKQGYKTSSTRNTDSMFEHQSKTLAEFGCIIKTGTIKEPDYP